MRNLLALLCVLSFYVNGFMQEELKWKEEVDRLKLIEHKEKSDAKGLIVLTGSSSARLWKNAQATFPKFDLINNGFGGSQMFELLYFLDDLVIQYKPDIVLIYEGDNDISAGKTTSEIMASTMQVVHKLKEELAEVQIYLISPKPSLSRWELAMKYIDLNKNLESFCNETEKVSFIDVWTPMLNEKGSPIEDIFVEDGLHMNEKGYEIWKNTIGPVINI